MSLVAFARITKTNGDIEFAPDKLTHWLNKLKWAENCPEQGMVDSNGLKSYGALCFQAATFAQYAIKYNLIPAAEPKEILNYLSDEETQMRLARQMILDNYDNWKHWRNSVKRIGLPPTK